MARLDRPDSTGGGAGIGGGARTGAGIAGKAGSNVRPIYKSGSTGYAPVKNSVPLNNNQFKASGSQGSAKPQPSTRTGDVRVNPKNNPLDGFPKEKTIPSQQQLGTAKGNARGMKAATAKLSKGNAAREYQKDKIDMIKTANPKMSSQDVFAYSSHPGYASQKSNERIRQGKDSSPKQIARYQKSEIKDFRKRPSK